MLHFRRRVGAWLAGAASATVLAYTPGALAQSAPVVSRPVVQSTPGADAQRLSAALGRIARDPRDYSSLVEAGDAANALGDPEAAAGFYQRADAISPNNPRIKAGLARALVLQGKPTEAIPLFASAEAGGAGQDVTADRGLAYDLVGDTVTAQKYYQLALARKNDDEVRRRLGVSQAIAGDAATADATLMPLLRKQDKPAWRAHAFALAIAGKTKEAVDTVNAILPGPLAQSVTPYLRYMPRLTRAQQAAAVNLGKFPRASDIGRDDPAIAAYAPTATRLAGADAGLIPRGRPLGGSRSRTARTGDTDVADTGEARLTSSQRRARDKAARLAQAEAVRAARVAPPEPKPTIDRDGELPPVASTPMTPAFASTPAPAPAQPTRLATAASRAEMATPAPLPTARTTRPTPSPTPPPARVATLTLPTAATSPAPAARQDVPERPTMAPAPAPGFDLARLGKSTVSTTPEPPASAPSAGTAASSAPVSLAQAFADLGSPSVAPAPIAGAVDVRAIEPAKVEPAKVEPVMKAEVVKPEPAKATSEKAESAKLAARKAEDAKATGRKGLSARAAAEEEAAADKKLAETGKGKKADAKKADAKKAEAKKAPPSHPSRIWVQIGVGRNVSAIAYDWRKSVKENPALFKGREASTSDMGRTNRVLVGPFTTQKAAAAFVTQAKKADVGGVFIWNSPAGQVVDPLDAK